MLAKCIHYRAITDDRPAPEPPVTDIVTMSDRMTSVLSRQIAGVVLCGGASRRMGSCKANLPWRGGTLLTRALACLETCCRPLIVSAAADQDLPRIPQSLVRVDDGTIGIGPLGAIASALRYGYKRGCSQAVVLAVDMPLVQPIQVERLIGFANTCREAVIPTQNGVRQPLFALYPTAGCSIAEDLLAHGERSVQAFLSKIESQALPEDAFDDLDPDRLAFQACNTPEEYQRLIEWDRRRGDPR